MHAQVGRFNYYHGQKRQLLGHSAGAAAPAWKTNQQLVQRKAAQLPGSKILMSNLPADVNEVEIDVSTVLVSYIFQCL